MNLQEKLALIEEVLDVETGSLTPETLLAEVGDCLLYTSDAADE